MLCEHWSWPAARKVEMKESCRCECLCSCSFFFFGSLAETQRTVLSAACFFFCRRYGFVLLCAATEPLRSSFHRSLRGIKTANLSSRIAFPWCSSLHFYGRPAFLVYIIYEKFSEFVAALLVLRYQRCRSSARLIYRWAETREHFNRTVNCWDNADGWRRHYTASTVAQEHAEGSI